MRGSQVKRQIALIAHDNKKPALLDWVKKHRARLADQSLCATGTTGALIARETGLRVRRFKSGPLGGDLQIGGRISEGKIDLLVFFWDPLSPHPHDPDVRALLRVATVYDILIATGPATADAVLAGMKP